MMGGMVVLMSQIPCQKMVWLQRERICGPPPPPPPGLGRGIFQRWSLNFPLLWGPSIMMGGMARLATQTTCQSEGVAPAFKDMWSSSPSFPWFGQDIFQG